MSKINFLKKIAKVQKAIGPIVKDSTNPHFKSSYFDINTLIAKLNPVLEQENLLLVQPIEGNEVKSIIVDLETGEQMASGMILPSLDNPQKTGSCVTYFRRYTLQTLLALEAEDDDGNEASGTTSNEEKQWLNVMDKQQKNYTPQWENLVKGIVSGKVKDVASVRKVYKVNKEVETKIEELLNTPQTA